MPGQVSARDKIILSHSHTDAIGVSYTYDAWGCEKACTGTLSGTLGYYNPLRYRGYVYDPEFKLYYLESRYYNPGLGRFNAPDAFAATGQGILGNNMYAYCNNNPVNYVDSNGKASKSCLHDFTEPDSPWRDSGSGGGRPYRHYSSGSNYYGEVSDKFYTIRILNSLGIDEISDVKSLSKINKGRKSIVDGFALILTPVPTTAEDLLGVYRITSGVINVCWGFAEWIGDLRGK